MPSIPFVDKGKEVYIGRDTTAKADLAEVLFSICILVFKLFITVKQELWPFLLFPFPPTLLGMNKLSFEKNMSSRSGSVLWCLRHVMTSINYIITVFIPLTRLQVKFDQGRAMPHLSPKKQNATLTKKQLLLSIFVTTRNHPNCASARDYGNGLGDYFLF